MRTTLLFLAALLSGFAAAPAAIARDAACPTAALEALPVPASRSAVEAGEPLTVVAFGSSSTEGAGASAPALAYPARLEALLKAALPGRPVRVLNRGVGGQDVVEMLARLDADVLAERPHLVVWQAGANAALRGMDPQAFRGRLAEGLARLRSAGADVVLMDNQLAPAVVSRPLHPYIAAALREAAAALSVPIFSRTGLMRLWEAAGTPPGELLHPDGLHHNDRGYACIAEALAATILRGLGGTNPVMARR
ncbi:MAG: SGNH/GDSL hydrolase family protein [Acetobacteraceae bacterium]|nr:SGNH/GDSL hydrolase family protein [Acetobacteraceae bacterium]